jgi:hypothetical protein
MNVYFILSLVCFFLTVTSPNRIGLRIIFYMQRETHTLEYQKKIKEKEKAFHLLRSLRK